MKACEPTMLGKEVGRLSEKIFLLNGREQVAFALEKMAHFHTGTNTLSISFLSHIVEIQP